MHALGHDEHPDVANYIGYANRKMGNYDQSKIWYEAALKADPNHTRTWSYYGMWQMDRVIGSRRGLSRKGEAALRQHQLRGVSQLKAVIDGKASY